MKRFAPGIVLTLVVELVLAASAVTFYVFSGTQLVGCLGGSYVDGHCSGMPAPSDHSVPPGPHFAVPGDVRLCYGDVPGLTVDPQASMVECPTP